MFTVPGKVCQISTPSRKVESTCSTRQALTFVTKLVWKKAFDAKRRRRNKKSSKNHEKLNYVNGGTQV